MNNQQIVLRSNFCVCCGEEIPEGIEVCPLCMNDPMGILERLQKNSSALKNQLVIKSNIKNQNMM